MAAVLCCCPALSEPNLSVPYSEGVFKCPEDQLPLDYAKVSPTCGTQLWGGISSSPVPSAKGLAHSPGTAAIAWHSCLCRSKSPLCCGARERKPTPDKGSLFVCRRGGSGPGQHAHGSWPGWGGGFRCPYSLAWDADAQALPLQIYPDPELEAQVLSLAIRCIHSEEGCRWSGLIKHLQVGAGWRWELGQVCTLQPPPFTIPVPLRPILAPVASTSSLAPTGAAPS